MRRNLAVLAIFVLGSGFHHGHHHHGGGDGGGTMGCGSSPHVESATWKLSGTVHVDAEASGNNSTALIEVRDAKTGAAVSGALVSVEDQRLVEIGPGEYAGALALQPGETVWVGASGSDNVEALGVLPKAATNLALAADGASVRFDERGAATALQVVAHGDTDATQTTTTFEEDATIELPVPHVDGLRSVEVRVQDDAVSADGLSDVTLQTGAATGPLVR